MIEKKEIQESSTIAEETPSSKSKEVKKFITFQMKQKESKEKRKQICRKYREKKKCYLKELESEIRRLEKESNNAKSNCDLFPSNCIQGVLTGSLPFDINSEFFGSSQSSFVNLCNVSEIELYVSILKIKQSK